MNCSGHLLTGAYLSTFAGQALITLMGIASGVICARYLHAEGRGNLALITMVPSLTMRLGNLSMIQTVAHISSQNTVCGNALATTAIMLALGLSIVEALLVLPTIVYAVPSLTHDDRLTSIALLALLPLTYSLYVLLGLDLGTRNFLRYSVLQSLPVILYVPFLAVVIITGNVSPANFALASLAGWAVAVLIRLPEIWGTISKRNFSPPLAAELLRRGATLAATDVSGLVLSRLDSLILPYLVQPSALGLYTVASAIANGQAAAASPAAQVAYRAAVGSEAQSGAALLARQFRNLQIPFFSIALATALATPPLISLAFGSAFLEAQSASRLLVLAMLLWSCAQVIENGMRGLGMATACSTINLFTIAITSALSIVAVPEFGIEGMALTMVAGQSMALMLKISVFQRYSGVPWQSLWGLTPQTAASLICRGWQFARASPVAR